MLEPDKTEFLPDWFSKPADSVIGLIRRRGLSVERVANALDGGVATIRELMDGTRAIDQKLAVSLSRAVGGSPTFWLKRQAHYERALDAVLKNAVRDLDAWLQRVSTPGPKPRGRLSDSQKAGELRKRLAFYGVNSLEAWEMRYGQQYGGALFRTSPTFSSKEGSVSLWLRLGEVQAALTTTAKWDSERLRSSLDDILALSRIRQPERFLPKLKALGAQSGVAIVVVRAPEGCRASGASRMVSLDKAMVLLSFRHLSDDHFWFTLFHEFGHLILHGAKTFVDADGMALDDKEREANNFATSCIIPANRWEEFANLRFDTKSILRFGVSLGISPGLVVGQLQHRNAVPPERLNFLKRRWKWEEIEQALS